MEIKRIVNKPVSSNCFLIIEDNNVIVVDPGTTNCEELMQNINSRQLKIEYIILTHEHFDHCAGCNILRALTKAPLLCSTTCSKLIQSSRKNYSEYWAKEKPFTIKEADYKLKNKEKMDWHGHEVIFYEALGHSKGSIAIQIDKVALFTGDNFIPNIRTYTNLGGASKTDLIHTLVMFQNLATNKDMIVYPGHLEPLRITEARFHQAVSGISVTKFFSSLN